jgi:hypothetical protein
MCHDRLGAVHLACPDCRTCVHDDCQAELARCPTLGCGSLRPWRWVEPAPAPTRRPRLERVAALLVVAAGVVAAVVLSSAAQVVAKPGVKEPPIVLMDPGRIYVTKPRSAWLGLGPGSELVVHSQVWETYRVCLSHGPSYLQRSITREAMWTYRVISREGDEVTVVAEPHDGGPRQWLRFDASTTDHPIGDDRLVSEASRVVVEGDRGSVVRRELTLRGVRDGSAVTIRRSINDLPLPAFEEIVWDDPEVAEADRRSQITRVIRVVRR